MQARRGKSAAALARVAQARGGGGAAALAQGRWAEVAAEAGPERLDLASPLDQPGTLGQGRTWAGLGLGRVRAG